MGEDYDDDDESYDVSSNDATIELIQRCKDRLRQKGGNRSR